jgi:hypothetical protein
MNLEIVEQYLQSLSPQLDKDIERILTSKLPEGTTRLDFEIRPESFNYYVMCYPMNDESTQCGSPFKVLEDYRNVGIIIPADMQGETDDEMYKLEDFCMENQPTIIDLITKAIQQSWSKAQAKLHVNIEGYVAEQDSVDDPIKLID